MRISDWSSDVCSSDLIERTEAQELQQRAEPFALRMLPRGCLLLLAGADTQDNRVEVGVWGYGRGGEMWTIDHQIFFGNPAQQQVWDDVAEFLLQAEYPHEEIGRAWGRERVGQYE